MKTRTIFLTFTSLLFIMCNTTFLNHKDYRFRLKDFVWDVKIENLPGEIYINDSTILFGSNIYAKFLVLSIENGAILDTLKPFTVEVEKNYQRIINIPIDKQKYAEATFKIIDRQFRGDTETYYLIVKTLSNKTFTLLFSRSQFPSIQDVAYFKEGKFIVTYNGEAGSMDDKSPYTIYVGLLDLDKIIKK